MERSQSNFSSWIFQLQNLVRHQPPIYQTLNSLTLELQNVRFARKSYSMMDKNGASITAVLFQSPLLYDALDQFVTIISETMVLRLWNTSIYRRCVGLMTRFWIAWSLCQRGVGLGPTSLIFHLNLQPMSTLWYVSPYYSGHYWVQSCHQVFHANDIGQWLFGATDHVFIKGSSCELHQGFVSVNVIMNPQNCCHTSALLWRVFIEEEL
jgi:hypothetical protein